MAGRLVRPGTADVLAILCSAFLIGVPAAAVAAVGATPGTFAVSANGAASYAVPIAAPPGTGNVVPRIALVYDTQPQNQGQSIPVTNLSRTELVGVGWEIAGLSSIKRCGRTEFLDGAAGSVNYDANDHFCLDGERLIAVSGTYGASGTEYRTERETFARVFSYDTSVCGLDNGSAPSTGPACFKVTRKDGSVLEYGVTADSRIQARGQTVVRAWALNSLRDVKGNYYTVSYFENNANGEYGPSRVDYTGNSSTGLSPYNSVRFEYEPRGDPVLRTEAGVQVTITQRLTHVKTYTGSALVKDYRLGYDYGGEAAASRLTSLRECSFMISDCLGDTAFAWVKQGAPLFDLLARVTTGLGVVTLIDYRPLTDTSIYTKATDAVYPYQDVQDGLFVVTGITHSERPGVSYTVVYRYGSAKFHATGARGLGFGWIQSTDGRNGVVTKTTYLQVYNGTQGLVRLVETRANAVLVRATTTNWSSASLGAGRMLPYVSSAYDQFYDLASGAQTQCLGMSNTFSTFDAAGAFGNYGGPSTTTRWFGYSSCALSGVANVPYETSNYTYYHDTTNWILGLPTRKTLVGGKTDPLPPPGGGGGCGTPSGCER